MGRHRACRLVAGLAILAASHAAGGEAAHAPVTFEPLVATTVEYRWLVQTPVWIVEPRRVGMHVHAPALRPARIDYDVVEWTSERRKFGRVPEFHCKYSDLGLPNECRTTWRDVYVDVPVAVLRRDYLDVDVFEWSRQDWHTIVDVPRLVWKAETLIVSLPALAASAARNP